MKSVKLYRKSINFIIKRKLNDTVGVISNVNSYGFGVCNFEKKTKKEVKYGIPGQKLLFEHMYLIIYILVKKEMVLKELNMFLM